MNDFLVAGVRAEFHYDEELGRLRRRVSRYRNRIGEVAGAISHRKHGDRVNVYYRGKVYQNSRLVWAYHKGEWPPEGMVVDHINGDTLDDRIENLQLLYEADNIRRSRKPRSVTSKYRGVAALDERWTTRVRVEGKDFFLGTFDTEEEAASAYEFCCMLLTDGQWVPAEYAGELPPPPAKLFKGKGWRSIVQHLTGEYYDR